MKVCSLNNVFGTSNMKTGHATRNMPRTRDMQHATCRGQATCDTRHAEDTRHATRDLPRTCDTRHAEDTRHATRDMPRTCDTRHAEDTRHAKRVEMSPVLGVSHVACRVSKNVIEETYPDEE